MPGVAEQNEGRNSRSASSPLLAYQAHHRRDGVGPVKHAGKGYDYPRCRRYLQRRGIMARIARRGIEDSSRLGRVRWVVERTMAWLLGYRRLALRYDRTQATLSALLILTCTLICHRRLPGPQSPTAAL